jgi:hypothetical protein
MNDRAKLKRIEIWIIVLTGIVVLAAIVGPFLLRGAQIKEANETQLAVSCQGVENQVIILEALRSAFEGGLGVPWTFPIPEVPPECDGS